MTGQPGAIRDPGDLFSVAGRAFIVTGASSGLGDRFTRLLAGCGASVLAVARRADRLATLADEFETVVPYTADLSDMAQCPGVVDEAMRVFGRIDGLVNNAGLGKPAPSLDEDIADFQYILDINLTAPFALARAAARHMIASGGGSIVNIASILGAGRLGAGTEPSYCASKGGIVHLSRELGVQWARTGVRVNALAPGHFPSGSSDAGAADEQWMSYLKRNTPMGRRGRVEELDGALLFLLSDASTFYTGQVLTVDGGWTAR